MNDILINIIPVIIIPFLGNLIFHELGHLLGGLLTGWKFIYLQLFNFAIIKEKKLFKVKRLLTLNFQCLMYPASKDSGALIYTISGCIMNFILGLLGLIAMVFCSQDRILWMYGWSYFVSGIGFFLINGIPSTKRICNDMACYQLLKADKTTYQCHNAQLMVARELSCGNTYRQIDNNLIFLSPALAENDILAYQAILEYYCHLDHENYDLAQKSLEKIDLNFPLSREITDILYMERLYFYLLMKLLNHDYSINAMNESYQDDMEDDLALHETIGDIHSMRVRVTYDLYHCFLSLDTNKAVETIKEGKSRMERMRVLYPGERVFCMNQLYKLQKYFMKTLIET